MPTALPSERRWYFARGNQPHGPFTLDELRQMLSTGQLGPTELVASEGGQGWLPAAQILSVAPAPAAMNEPSRTEGWESVHPGLGSTWDGSSDPGHFATPVVGPATPTSLVQPIQVGNYELLGEIGKGGMGVVYRARDVRLGRFVALKMIHEQEVSDPAHKERFLVEARTLARLQHSNIVKIFDVGEHQGRPYFAMELVPGGTLAHRLESQPQEPRTAAALVETLARAMHEAHQAGIVHRDLKPQNILIAADGRPKITDFGLARDLRDQHRRTHSGAVLGTLVYMAPEQARGDIQAIGPHTDVYALGIMLYEMLTGYVPFTGPNMAVLYAIMEREPDPPSRIKLGVPKELETIVLRCLRKEPAQRYPTALALAEDLARFLRGELSASPAAAPTITSEAVPASSLSWLTALGLLTLGLALGGGAVWGLNLALSDRSEIELRREKAESDAQAAKILAEQRQSELETARRLAEQRQTQLQAALTRAETAEKQLAPSKQALERLQYIQGIRLAWRQYLDDGIEAARETLNATPMSRRNLEFRFLDRLLNNNHKVFTTSTELTCLKATRDGRLVAGCGDGRLRVWDAGSGQLLRTIPGHGLRINSLAISPNGKRVASCANRYTPGDVRVFDLDTGQEIFAASVHTNYIYDVAFSPDGKQLVTASWDRTLKVLDAETGKEIRTLTGHKDYVVQVAWSPDGKKIASRSWRSYPAEEGEVKVWNAENGDALLTFTAPQGAWGGVAFSPDSLRLAVGGYTAGGRQGLARLHDAGTGRELCTLLGHSGGINRLGFSPDGQRLITAGADRSLRIWDSRNGQELQVLRGHTLGVAGFDVAPDGQTLYSASYDRTLRVWEFPRSAVPLTVVLPLTWVSSVAVSPDGKRFVIRGTGDQFRVYDAENGRSLASWQGTWSDGSCLAFSPRGDLLAAGGWNRKVSIRDAGSGTLLAATAEHKESIYALCFSPDGQRVASGSSDRTVKIWAAKTGRELMTLRGHTRTVKTLAFDPEGKRLASSGEDGTLRIWDAEGRELLKFDLGPTAVSALVFTPDGKSVIFATEQGTVEVREAATGERRQSFRGHTAAVHSLAISPDGKRLITGAWDASVRIWDVESGEELLTFSERWAGVSRVVFSGNGRRLVSAGSTGTIKVWTFPE